MSILLSAHQLSISFGAKPLFQKLAFTIESGEKIGLIGPNGAGKSTLLKIMAALVDPDEGTLSRQKGLRVAYLEQSPTFPLGMTVIDAVLSHSPEKNHPTAKLLHQADTYISQLALDSYGDPHTTLVDSLSGGQKKRVAIARELMCGPELFLLDEPTNHLDVESIIELEKILNEGAFATITITHDRVFLQNVSTRILELDRRHANGLLSVDGDYQHYLEVRSDLMNAQEQQELKLSNTLRREQEWLKQGAKARTTKQQARIKGAAQLESKVDDLRDRNQKLVAKIDFQSTSKAPKKLIEATQISKTFGDKTILPPMDLLITRTSRLGLLGQNGCGKSTLIKMLLGHMEPDQGTINRADDLQVSYFEQSKEILNGDINLIKTVCPYGDHVDFAGTSMHVKGYLARFLFSPEQMQMPVRMLSGGERARLLIAKLMLRPAQLLILDEPTNDLDLPTLNILEEVLRDFSGAIILVTHDRYFLDQICSQILYFDTNHDPVKLITFEGLAQWEDYRQLPVEKNSASSAPVIIEKKIEKVVEAKKINTQNKNELAKIQKMIDQKESEVSKWERELLLPEIYSSPMKASEISKKMLTIKKELEDLYSQWEKLEAH
ncbi:MAG: ABC-F family ATP-binding cassette domain-containing protein [Bacteriovoracaceae bacterium]|nr:ABC-F family ATP-binding cassette domain-containing protein [Bacteriovoracaceae bacterium]